MTDKIHLNRPQLQNLYADMLRIRRFEAKCTELYQAQKIRGFLHLYDGQEAVAVGVLAALSAADAVVATYREHGHALARGVPMKLLLAEMLGKVEGCCRGRGGSMHIFDRGLPLAVGIAMADKQLRPGAVTACFFGEGAVAEGAFHESMNLAAIWQLPVLFVCENNLYAMGVPLANAESQTDIYRKAEAYRMASMQVDAMQPLRIEAAARQALAHVRGGRGPFFLECRTYRFRAHSMFDTQAYRTREEVDQWQHQDPVQRLRNWLASNHWLTAEEETAIDTAISTEIEAAAAFAEAGTLEPVADLERFVLMATVVQENAGPQEANP
jgi:pyruvate dehydrogenase E1 component alpha subunit